MSATSEAKNVRDDSTEGQIIFKDLFGIASRLDDLPWQPFREGVRILRLYGSQASGPSAALLRYEPGAGVPYHQHLGYEHILILSASQTDQTGEKAAGTLIVNPPGSSHSVLNERGGVVLAIWEKPIAFLAPRPEPVE